VNINAMRAIDRFAGVPLCWAAGVYHRLLPGPADSGGDRPIVVMKFFGMGSVLLSTPLLQALRHRYPDRRIIYVTFGFNREILERLPQPAVRLTIATESPFRFLRDVFRTLIAVRRSRPGMVFDLEFFSKFSTLLAALSGAPVRIGFELPTRWRHWNLTHPALLDSRVHVTESFLRQLNAIGGPPARIVPVTQLQSTEADRAVLQNAFPQVPGDAEWIAVNVNAGRTSIERRWPPERFMDVVRHLSRGGTRRRFAFIGSEDERSYISAAFATAPDLEGCVTNCAGKLTLGGLIALLERSALLLTNDSGPMHIAGAVGTPVVALFGPESPVLYGPPGDALVMYKSLSCSPCLTVYNAKQFVCPFNARCMKEIGVEEVASAAGEFLSSSQTGVA
jgi:ADP-heptose:LPS heptosyltransferase